MDAGNNHNIYSEVEERLDDLFEDGKTSIELSDDGAEFPDSPLMELKAILLSIDWEITDEIMFRLIEKVDALKDVYSDDKILILFLQLIGTVGKYIKTHKASAHPDSLKLLNSVYNGLEKVAITEGMMEDMRKKTLFDEVRRFKRLKEKISLQHAETEKKAENGNAPKDESKKDDLLFSAINRMTPHEAFAYALAEIKQVISAEFQALRAELRLWREGQ